MKEWVRTRDRIQGFRITPTLRRKLDDKAIFGYRAGEYDFYTLARLLALPIGVVKAFLIEWEHEHGCEPVVLRKEL